MYYSCSDMSTKSEKMPNVNSLFTQLFMSGTIDNKDEKTLSHRLCDFSKIYDWSYPGEDFVALWREGYDCNDCQVRARNLFHNESDRFSRDQTIEVSLK